MSLTELLALLEELGSTPSEDGVGFTELDHGLQCASELAQRRPADVELQLAGLVHDVGHQFGSDEAHARLGAEAVRPVLGERVADLVEAHVIAKRYLVATDLSYSRVLSAVSMTTLAAQGGPLDVAAIARFRASALFGDALELRRADDAAKIPGRIVPGLSHWTAAVRRVARVAG